MCLLLSALPVSSSTSSAFQLCYSQQSPASSGFAHNVAMQNLSSRKVSQGKMVEAADQLWSMWTVQVRLMWMVQVPLM